MDHVVVEPAWHDEELVRLVLARDTPRRSDERTVLLVWGVGVEGTPRCFWRADPANRPGRA